MERVKKIKAKIWVELIFEPSVPFQTVNKNISIRGKIGSWSQFVFKDFNFIVKFVSIFANVMNFKVCHFLKNVGFKFNLRSTYQKCILFCVKRTKTFCESNTKMHKKWTEFLWKKRLGIPYHGNMCHWHLFIL